MHNFIILLTLNEVYFTAFSVDFHKKKAYSMHKIRNIGVFIFDIHGGCHGLLASPEYAIVSYHASLLTIFVDSVH